MSQDSLPVPSPMPLITAPIGTVGTGKAVSAVDAKGNAALPPADLVFTSSDPSILALVDHGDGSATVTPQAVGTATVSISSASTRITQVQPFQVVAGPPVSIQVQWNWG